MIYVIKSRWDSSVVFRGEADSVRELVENAVACGANLEGAALDLSLLRSLKATAANKLVRCDLEGAHLAEARLVRSCLSESVLDFSNLYSANFTGACLSSVSMYGANASRAIFERANLNRLYADGANFFMANLRQSNMEHASFYGANLARADFTGAKISKDTNFQRANLDGAVGLP